MKHYLHKKRWTWLAALTAAFILPAAHAETLPSGSLKDHRIQTAVYHADQVYRIHGAIGKATLIELEDGETLDGDAALLGMGDADAWKVAVKGNGILFKPTAVHPDTNMLIRTNRRTYALALSLVKGKQQPTYVLRFTYPDTAHKRAVADAEKMHKAIAAVQSAGLPETDLPVNRRYWAYGDKVLAPTAAWDNGRFTYLKFNNGKDLPAVYKILEDGTETLVNSHIEGDTVVIHETGKRFVLRLGKAVLAVDNRGFDQNGLFNRSGTDSNDTVRIRK